MLLLAGIELTFFTVASMGLFWVCAENSVDNTRMFLLPWSSAYTEARTFLLLTPPQQWGGWGAHAAGRGHSQDSWPQLAQGMFHAIRRHAQHVKLGDGGRGETFGVMAFVFPSNCYMWWSPALLGMAEHPPASGKWWKNSFFCFACRRGFCFTY